MRYFVVICCVLASVVAKDKKVSLEDIERDNLKSSKTTPQKTLAGSPTDYGFLPVKTATDYTRQQPKYVPYVPPQQYTPPIQQYQPSIQQYQSSIPQYQAAPQQYYYPQQSLNLQNPYQQYENVQYIADNSIAQQQYYTPQYVYLQQYSAPSTAVQSVVDPKGGIQYVMYVPSYTPKAEQTQSLPNVVYANDQQTYTVPETQYVAAQPETPSIKYVTPQKSQVYTKQEPKSLLDSYVPSILQVQYYKQQQARANAIQQSLKDAAPAAKGYRSAQTQHNSAESIVNYTYQIPSTHQKYN